MVAFVSHTWQGSVERFVLCCSSFEEGLQSLLASEMASVGIWRSLVKTSTRRGEQKSGYRWVGQGKRRYILYTSGA